MGKKRPWKVMFGCLGYRDEKLFHSASYETAASAMNAAAKLIKSRRDSPTPVCPVIVRGPTGVVLRLELNKTKQIVRAILDGN